MKSLAVPMNVYAFIFKKLSFDNLNLLTYSIVKEVVEGKSQDLLESVAQLIASATLRKHPQISAVRVKVGKPHVAVHGPLDYLGVEIVRYRSIDAPN